MSRLRELNTPIFWVERGYTDGAYLEACLVRDMNDGGRIRYVSEEEWKERLDN